MGGQNITPGTLNHRRVRMEFLHLAGSRPIGEVTPDLAAELARRTGVPLADVEAELGNLAINPLDAFGANFVDMAYSGREQARDFELATAAVFRELGYRAERVGPAPLHPDVLVTSPMDYRGIIDSKAYSAYSMSNDWNRMVHNYIPRYRDDGGLAFFAYVAGGFSGRIDAKIQSVAEETAVCGSAVTARDLVEILRRHRQAPITHERLKVLFQANRRVAARDIAALESQP